MTSPSLYIPPRGDIIGSLPRGQRSLATPTAAHIHRAIISAAPLEESALSQIAAILFDLDGTLVDSREDITASVNEVRRLCDLPPLPVDQVARMVGLGIRVLLRRAVGVNAALNLDEAITLFRGHYWDHCLDRTILYDGVVRTLEVLPQTSLGVVSNKPVRFCRKILEGLGVAERFGVILGGDSTPERKPHPEPIIEAMRELGVPPSGTMIVGDSPVDVTAGRRAGIRTCGVTYGLGSAEELVKAGPTHLIDRIADLPAIVGGAGDAPP